MPLWGEFEDSSSTSYTPIKIPNVAKGRPKPQRETIIGHWVGNLRKALCL